MNYLKLLRGSRTRRRESIRRGKVQREAPAAQCEEAGALEMLSAASADHQRLKRAGFRPKISFGERVIWQRPDTGFWFSQEMALHLLQRWGKEEDKRI